MHDYLPHNSTHPKHCKDNLPYNLAKGIFFCFFVSNDEKVEMRLKDLKNWLKDCNYPDSVINQSFYDAKLQGPVPFTDNSKNIPFVTTYYENIDYENVVRKIRSKLSKIQSRHLSEVFKNKNVILFLHSNLIVTLTSFFDFRLVRAFFNSNETCEKFSLQHFLIKFFLSQLLFYKSLYLVGLLNFHKQWL